MRKRIAGLMLCAVAVFALTACGNTTKQEDKGAQKQTETKAPEKKADAGTDDKKKAAEIEVTDRKVYVPAEWVKKVVDGTVPEYKEVVIAQAGYGKREDDKEYGKGHVKGAIYLDVAQLEDATGSKEGAYNLFPAEKIKDYLLKNGITSDTKLVIYAKDPMAAARAAYACLWTGVKNIKILNGGMDAWTKVGGEVQTDANDGKEAKDFGVKVPANPQYYVTMDEAKKRLAEDKNFKLVSIRTEPEWLGETSGYNYIDRAGEPEGAVWGKGCKTAYDVADFTNPDGTIKDLAGLKEVWKDCDFNMDNHLSFYCGTGWRAAVPFLVLYGEGMDNISLYDGGWYEWQMYPENKVQVGDPKSKDCKHVTVADLPTDKAAK